MISFIINWVIHFCHFPHITIVRLIFFITAGCLESISNVAYNFSDPSNDKYPRKYKEVFIAPDLTASQRKRETELKKENKARKEKGEEGLYIKRGVIYKKSK